MLTFYPIVIWMPSTRMDLVAKIEVTKYERFIKSFKLMVDQLKSGCNHLLYNEESTEKEIKAPMIMSEVHRCIQFLANFYLTLGCILEDNYEQVIYLK